MKVYDLSKIMKRAHNLYNNARAKYPTFSEALKRSWKMAKFDVQVADSAKYWKPKKKRLRQKNKPKQKKLKYALFFSKHSWKPTVSNVKQKPEHNA